MHGLLYKYSDHDFSRYKATTVMRRIHRRMAIHEIDDNGQYAQFLPGLAGAGCRPCGNAYVVVTHLPKEQRSLLPELLRKHTTMSVAAVSARVAVEPDKRHSKQPNPQDYTGYSLGALFARITLPPKPGFHEFHAPRVGWR
ncbi:MAG: hypothetical protein WD873_02520 [Candidatus Hydrogenedentales bacterium]